MLTVLVADDSKSVRAMLASLLLQYDFQVIEASNGLEAKTLIQQMHPDIVLTDVVMPEMNGYELCRWIKQDKSCEGVPVIFCSVKGEDFDRHWGMKQGGDAYISKPFQPEQLLAEMRKLLQKPLPIAASS